MVANDGQHEAQGLQRLADVFAGDGVELHHLPFLGRKVAALFQNFIGHGDLAQVVQISASPEGEDGIFVHAEMAPEIGGVNRQPLAMAFGVGIAAFDDEPKRAQDGIGGFEFVGKFLQAQKRFHASEKFFGEIGLLRKSSAPASMPRTLSLLSLSPVIRTKGIRRVAGSSFSCGRIHIRTCPAS